MATALVPTSKITPESLEAVLVKGDLQSLKPAERIAYYQAVCESVGLNPLTQPFAYITLNGKLTLYAKRDATDQLRLIHSISIKIAAREVVEGCYVVTAQASTPAGRTDESIGAVPIEGLKGEARSNAIMKSETKAKRRVTLGICGLAFLDETEVASIPGARIDDGRGSTEARQEVLTRKLEEIRSKPALVPAAIRPAAPQLAAAIAETVPALEDEDREVEYEEVEMAPEEVSDLERDMAASVALLNAFGALKSRYLSIGMTKTYDAILALHGKPQGPGGFTDLEEARACYRELLADLRRREGAR